MITIASYRAGRGGVLKQHWLNGGAVNCGKANGTLQRWRDMPATEVAVLPALCGDCREALIAKSLIVPPKKKD